MARTLGLDLGTNSIGWAVVEGGRQSTIIDRGTIVFQKGVDDTQHGEESRTARRTRFRAARRIKQRRRMRKVQTLRVLSNAGLCPALTEEELSNWQRRKEYPANRDFRQWLRTSEATDDAPAMHPYYCRHRAVTVQLDMNRQEDRWILGRSFYHIAQRRGYRSNRVSGDEKDGAVAEAIQGLRAAMNGRTLGQYYFEECYGQQSIRGGGHYTSREDYEEEFTRICAFQNLDPRLQESLRQAIFMQRPLKSQRGSVGTCLLERGKPRAAISHPLYERFRVLQFVNSIRVRPPQGETLRVLTSEERAAAVDWLSKRERPEKFAKLAKAIVPRRATLAFGRDWREAPPLGWGFSHRDDTTLPSSPFTARMRRVFGDEWEAEVVRRYARAGNKSPDQIITDVWHAVYGFDDREKLNAFLCGNLDIGGDDAERLGAPLPQGFASLSLRAIRKILPGLERGLLYAHAVFLANIPTILAIGGVRNASIDAIEREIRQIMELHRIRAGCIAAANAILKRMADDETVAHGLVLSHAEAGAREVIARSLASEDADGTWQALSDGQRTREVDRAIEKLKLAIGQTQSASGATPRVQWIPMPTIRDQIAALLVDNYVVPPSAVQRLYHPSAIEAYPASSDGRLGNPEVGAIKNPVFYRTMYQLRGLVNELLHDGIIDRNTHVRIEMARELNDANERAAIRRWQRKRETERSTFAERIREYGVEPTDALILKYQLWEEQNRDCLYTGRKIGIGDLLSETPTVDVEHTIPRSRRLDNSQENMTLCDGTYNRDFKRQQLPSELREANAILLRATRVFQPRIDALEATMANRRAASRGASEKSARDKARQDFLLARLERDYWRGKLRRFEMTEPPSGFTNNQLVDTRLICKYACGYMHTAFEKVYALRAGAIAMAKEIWGLDQKLRDNHAHHCVDAIVCACLSPRFYPRLAEYFRDHERAHWDGYMRPTAPEPWDGFARYLNDTLRHELLIVHMHKDRLFKQTRRKVRIRGKEQQAQGGSPQYTHGRGARGELHQETVYGQIQRPGTDGATEGAVVSVVRKRIDELKQSDLPQVVDGAVRRALEAQFDKIGKEAVWLNRELRIPIRKVRVRAKPKADSLIDIGLHRDASTRKHKQKRWAANGSNYAIAVYRGEIGGKRKSKWYAMTSYDAVRGHFDAPDAPLFSAIDSNGLALTYVLKTGTVVLVMDRGETVNDLRRLSTTQLGRRLYRVTRIEQGRVAFNHHQTALPATELGHGESKTQFDAPLPQNRLYLSVNGADFAVEGIDFRISRAGHFAWIEQG